MSLQKSGFDSSAAIPSGVTIFILNVLAVCLSCTQGKVLQPMEPSYAFTKEGRAQISIDRSRHHYYWFVTLDSMQDDLYHTPRGKIDKIMAENPDWQFICYCHANLSDSLAIVELLRRYDCSLPVVIDEHARFLTQNNIKERYSDIGFICDRNGRCKAVATIGTSQSFFDQEFASVKRSLWK